MQVLHDLNLLPEVCLPFEVASPSLRELAKDHPLSLPIPVLEDGSKVVLIPPEFLSTSVCRYFFALSMKRIDDGISDSFNVSVNVFC